MKINAAIIAKNEEQALPKCLNSLKGFDKIYLTDTGSTDKTIEIAKKHNAIISYRKWDNDFSKARNFNLDQIPKDEWVFIIDCDEYLPKDEIKKIRKAIEKSKTGRCFAHVKNVVDGGEHQHLRFFKNKIRYKDPAHTHIPVTNWDFTDVNLMHNPSTNHKKDPKRTLRILEAIKKPSPRELYLLGREYWNVKNYKKSIYYLRKYLANDTPNQLYADGLRLLAMSYFFDKQNILAKNAAMLAIIINPEFKEAFITMASLSNPEHMQSWLKYAKIAENKGIGEIPGKQEERIAELMKISELAIKGKLKENIKKGRFKKSKN